MRDSKRVDMGQQTVSGGELMERKENCQIQLGVRGKVDRGNFKSTNPNENESSQETRFPSPPFSSLHISTFDWQSREKRRKEGNKHESRMLRMRELQLMSITILYWLNGRLVDFHGIVAFWLCVAREYSSSTRREREREICARIKWLDSLGFLAVRFSSQISKDTCFWLQRMASFSVKIKSWHGVAEWSWDTNDDTCGICRNAFNATPPGVKFPGFPFLSCRLLSLLIYWCT